MLRLCASVTTIQHLMGIKIRPCFSLHRKLTRSHRAVVAGAVRWTSSCRPAPVLTAAPVRALIDEHISIKGHFLPPSSPVTVCARMHSEDGDLWEAFAHYNTNADGTVNWIILLAETELFNGTFHRTREGFGGKIPL